MNKDQALGAMVGLAIGDALGTTLEFSRNPTSDRNLWHTEITGGGPFNLTAGGWTDDTSMALALLQSYLDAKQFDPTLCARYFVDWYRNGAFSHTGDCFDIGFTTMEALSRCERFPNEPYQGSTDAQSSGNGGIMRLAPSVIANTRNIERAVEEAVNQSRITHASEESLLYAKLLARVLFFGDPFIDEVAPYALPDNTPWEDLLSGGYVKETFQCAMWAARNTESFEECLIHTVNRRFDADTTGAVAGQIAGAMYGLTGIPERWLEVLIDYEQIKAKADALFQLNGQ